MLNHGDDGLVLLLIDAVHVDGFSPHLVSLALSDQPWDHKLRVVGLKEVHETLGAVLGIHDTQVSVDSLVSSLEVHARFEQRDQLVEVAELLVEVVQIFKVIWVDDNVLTTESCHVELFSTDTGEADSFPDFRDIGFLGSFKGELVLLEVDVGLSKLLVVGDALVEDLSSLVKLVIEAAVTTVFDISLVRITDE